MSTTATAVRQEAHARLLEACPHGTRIFAVLRHVAASGMSRRISLHTFYELHTMQSVSNISGHVGRLLDIPVNADLELTIRGCGSDAAKETVAHLALRLYGDARALSCEWV